MISTEKIKAVWSAITPQPGSSIARRADPAHPLDLFIGFDEKACMQMMLLTDAAAELPGSSQQVTVACNQRSDGQFAICFTLVNPALKETFVSLCWDIMESSRRALDKRSGIQLAIKCFSMWQLLFASGSNSKLSDLVVRGLIGELSVLKNICIPAYGSAHSVTGWIGPLHADRDFEYESKWIEVKTAPLNKDSISISSFDQLDIDKPGNLIICILEKTSASDPQAITLNSLVHAIDSLLHEDDYALSLFHVRLTLNGYKDSDEAANDTYVVCGFESYQVENDFPRIRRSELPDGIAGGEYILSIPAIQTWRTE